MEEEFPKVCDTGHEGEDRHPPPLLPFSPTFIFPETMETVAYNSYYLRQELENLFFKR